MSGVMTGGFWMYRVTIARPRDCQGGLEIFGFGMADCVFEPLKELRIFLEFYR